MRAAFNAQAAGSIPTRLQVSHLLAQRHRRHRQLARIAAAIALLVLGGIGGWTARDVFRGLAW
jgi:hypothetical protein